MKGKSAVLSIVHRTVVLLSAIFILGGCSGGGGGGDTPATGGGGGAPAPTLSGVAAAGAPVVGTVTIKDSSAPTKKEKTVTIAADGKYTVDVSDMTGPFALRADGRVGGREYHLYSAAAPADLGGTINITPFTDLIIANIAGDLASNYFASGAYSSLSAAEITAAETALQQRLQPLLTAVGLADSIDLLRTSFNADHSGLDGLLDVVRVTVDPATATAEIRNLISNTAITDDLTSQTDTTAFTTTDAANVAAGVTDLQLIVAGFDRFSALFATSLPSPTDPQLLALFDQANFLDDGVGLDQFLTEVTSDPGIIGIKFVNVSVVSLDPVTGTGEVEFTPLGPGPGQAKVEIIRFKMVKSGSTWLMRGNQRIAHTSVSSQARFFTGSTVSQFETGIHFEIRDDGGKGIDYAIVKGPGLAVNGEVLVNNIAFDHFSLQNNLNNDLVSMDEATVGSIPDTGGSYTIELFDDSGTPTNSADDILLATYTETISKRPYKPSELTAASFPALTQASLSTWQTFTSGSLTVSWTLPAGLQSDFLFVNMFGLEGNAQTEASLTAAQTTATVTISPVTATGTPINVTSRNLDIGAFDGFSRSLSTIYFF